MKALTHPIPILALAVAVGAAVMSNLPVMALALVVGIAALGFLTIRSAQSMREDELGLADSSRIMVKRIRDHADRVEQFVIDHRDSTAVKIAGAQALEDAKALLKSSVELAQSKDRLARVAKTLTGTAKTGALKRVAQIDQYLADADDTIAQVYTELASALIQDSTPDAAMESVRDRLTQSAAFARSIREFQQDVAGQSVGENGSL